MLKRQIRERREYLYRKHKEEAEGRIRDRKEKLKRALDENKPIPTELREDALKLQEAIEYDDAGGQTFSSIDDEYKYAGVEDPKIMVTTSHDPSVKLKQFAKEMKLIFPNSKRINRGNTEMPALINECRKNNFTDLVVFHETRGKPDGMIVCHLPYGPTAYFNLSHVVMRHDIEDCEKMSEAFPHLIFHGFSTKLGERVTNILKYLFPVPKKESKRIMTFANTDDLISYRHHVYRKDENGKIELKEVGPRMEIKMFMIRQGTLDKEETSNVEFRIHPFMNTAKKRKYL
ncbi:Oidioi.mRNA.OKI2018_I69.PAR.g11292.t1.cds [Oikopleura dioica]|uniref:Oidioi.mRNA.OKI2018_I69.PAR.g11292.t1.cds n=1 Tax=Oikopleura dioica TaxID=34765 RepID=A0ABN7RVQ7_OIKDI|nr:Oidioi.mRNA.OKI2018_I69.PAR.g11292.t1.cds [Oikopleura dioica]